MTSIFKLEPYSNLELETCKANAVVELNSFFDMAWEPETIKLIVLPDRETINAWRGEPTKDYVIGWGVCTNVIMVLDPKNFDTQSSHKYSKRKVAKLVKHEITHLYMESVFGLSKFAWINEGVAVFLSKQTEDMTMPETFEGFLDKTLYWESGFAFELLFKKFGKDKLINFLKKQSGITDRENLACVFREVYAGELNYAFFNSLK